MRFLVLALLLVACPPAFAESPGMKEEPMQTPTRTTGVKWQTDGLDHAMLWTDNIDRTTSVFTVKLGFQVRPGGDFGDGVANRLLRIGDGSYIELLYTTRARAELDEMTRKDLDALHAGTGAKAFAVHPLDLDRVDGFLAAGASGSIRRRH